MQSQKFTVWYKCRSIDFRTNQWSVQCHKCKRVHDPLTTMLAKQLVTCDRCGAEEVIDWNKFVDERDSVAKHL